MVVQSMFLFYANSFLQSQEDWKSDRENAHMNGNEPEMFTARPRLELKNIFSMEFKLELNQNRTHFYFPGFINRSTDRKKNIYYYY